MDLEKHIKHEEIEIKLPIRYDSASPAKRAIIRKEYQKRQGNFCYYCSSDLDQDPPQEILDAPINWMNFPRHFLSHPVHLHHCHKTGLTLGAVHAYCNAVLWQYHGE